jgi:hypothetical protein
MFKRASETAGDLHDRVEFDFPLSKKLVDVPLAESSSRIGKDCPIRIDLRKFFPILFVTALNDYLALAP